MQNFKLGDQVTVLHETTEGRIVELADHQIKIEDADGFHRTYPAHLIVLRQAQAAYRIEKKLSIKDQVEMTRSAKKAVQPKIIKNPEFDRTELDLHIEELRDYTTHLTNFEIVQIQMTACRSFVQESIAAKRKRIVLIHGKGQGVLKSEIHQYLDRISNNLGVELDYHDASFNRYGMGGATEIIFYG